MDGTLGKKSTQSPIHKRWNSGKGETKMETIYVIFTIVGIVTIPLGVIFAIKEAHDFLVVVNMFASFTTSFAVVGRMLYGDPVPRDFEKILLVLALAVVYTAIVFLIQKPFWRNPNPLWN